MYNVNKVTFGAGEKKLEQLTQMFVKIVYGMLGKDKCWNCIDA